MTFIYEAELYGGQILSVIAVVERADRRETDAGKAVQPALVPGTARS